jgi:hypothetical protein
MKRRQFLVTPLLASGEIALSAGAALAGKTEWIQTRPRLFYDVPRIKQLRSAVRSGARAEEWQRILSRADGLMKAEFVSEAFAEEGPGDDARFGRPSQQIFDMAFTLGLAHHITGRQEYGNKLRDALLYFAGYRSWHGPGFPKRVPAWHAELNTARFCVAFGAGYDSVYDLLTAAERSTIRGAPG